MIDYEFSADSQHCHHNAVVDLHVSQKKRNIPEVYKITLKKIENKELFHLLILSLSISFV